VASSGTKTQQEQANAETVRLFDQLYNEERVEEAVTQTMTEDLEWKWTATRKWPAGAKAAMAS
jgi:hypothetical protein